MEPDAEVARRAFEALESDDLRQLLDTVDPQIVVRDHDLPDAADYLGFSGLVHWQEDWERAWQSWGWKLVEFLPAAGRVVVVLRVTARGRLSGAEVERVDGAVVRVRDGKVIELDYYGSRAQALEAAGLSERRS